MNASTGRENPPETRGQEVKSTECTSKWSRKGLASRGRLTPLAGLALRNPRQGCKPRPVPVRGHPLAVSSATREPPPTASALPPGRLAASRPLATIPHPGVGQEETRGARERRPAGGRGRDGAYLPWASQMAACDSAGTWPPPPSPGLETWRAGTKMAAPPNFHCYFGHSSSYFLGTRLPPCDGSGGNGTGTRLRHGGGRAKDERESEGREGRVKGVGEETKRGRWGGKR